MPSSITLTVKNLAASTSFFLSALQPLDYIYRGRTGNNIGFGLKDSPPDFWISQEIPGVPSGAAHVAFPAGSQKNVHDFFIAAIKAGGKCHGEPAMRDVSAGYYSAAVLDFDGNSIEAVFRQDLLDEGYGSRPSSVSSVSSVKSKPAMSSKASTTVSKASTVKPPPTEVRSVAPSSVSKAPSKAPTSVSRAPTSASRAPTQVSRAPSAAAPSQVSRAPSQASRAPTSVSRAPSQQAVPQAVANGTPAGNAMTSLVSDAQGAISVAKELVNHVRPALASVSSAPAVAGAAPADANSHKPSDTIVGTLLGVAAGAALHYAYTKVTEGERRPSADAADAQFYRPPMARTNTEPSFADQRMYYYHELQNGPTSQPYAIEGPESAYSGRYEPTRVGSQRYITMQDHDERLSEIAPSTVRPRRRSSFDATEVRTFVSSSRASQNPKSSARMIEGPPTSYRAPTAITQADNESRASGRSRSKSRISSAMRALSVSSDNKSRHGRRDSDEDLRSSARSHVSRRTSASKTRSRAPSVAASERSDARTVVPARSSSKAPSRAASRAPREGERSKAGTVVSVSPTEYASAAPSASKSVFSKLMDRERTGGRSDLTKSVVGKIQDSERLNVSNREIDPSDSVSQVSSVRSKRTSRR